MSIKDGIYEVIGKTIKEVIVNEGCGPYPEYHVFLVFTDDSFYEFYGAGHVNSISELRGDPIGYAKAFKSCFSISRYYKDNSGKSSMENLASK